MGKSQDTFNKKEREKKKQKRKKEKMERREQKKLEGKTQIEFMYVDENGNLTTEQPDPKMKKKVSLASIEISVPKQDKSDAPNFLRTGIVKFFNDEKGYGFIVDSDTKDSFFVHSQSLNDPIRDNDKVTFEVGKGPKGPVALDVKLV